jgi:hypothetical protein
MPIKAGVAAGFVPHRVPPVGGSWTVAAGLPNSLVVGTIVLLIIAVVVVMLLVITFGHLSWRARSPRSRFPRRRLNRMQAEAAAAVAELRRDDHYDPNGPGLDEDEL